MMVRFLCVAAVPLVTQSAMATPAPGPYPELDFNAISVQVRDANNDGHFNLYAGGADRSYVAGINGRAYKLIVRNRTGAPVLVVPSTDGVKRLDWKGSVAESERLYRARTWAGECGWLAQDDPRSGTVLLHGKDRFLRGAHGTPEGRRRNRPGRLPPSACASAESITPMRRDRAELEQKSRDASEGPASTADGAFADRAPAAPSLGDRARRQAALRGHVSRLPA